MPPIADPERRAKGEHNLEWFLQTYFPNSTGLSPFSDDHKKAIQRLQNCIVHGGRFINAVYRGFAKTSISTNAAIWAIAYAYRRYVAVFSATDTQAEQLIDGIKMELETNELLYEDFPEICHAFRELDGKAQRCASQKSPWEFPCERCNGSGQVFSLAEDAAADEVMGFRDCDDCEATGKITELRRTFIDYRSDSVAMPSVQGSKASGAVLASCGITGSKTRGLLITLPDGTKPRPDFVIIDDPQTPESARSPGQVTKRLDTIRRDILKLAGHRKSMAAVVNATVIAANDVVDQLLDPKRNPSWEGERIKMVKQWADAHDTLWLGTKDGFTGQCYSTIRNTWDRDNSHDKARAHREATEFYLANREAMDAGCVVSWQSCYDAESGEHSSIQHAYNFLIDDGPDVFATECQNESPKEAGAEERLTAAEIAERLNGFERLAFPRECEHVTAYIDVQGKLLYYVVAAWSQDFTGYVIDYGSFPDQRRRYYTLADAQRSLDVDFPGEPIETQWSKGLAALTNMLCARDWQRLDGTSLRMGKVIIDANYGASTKAVKRFCLTSPHSALLQAAHGKGITASDAPMGLWPVQTGERRGHNWMLRPDKEAKGLRHLLIDTNFWKSFIHARLRMAPTSRGSLSLWGRETRTHEMFADHLTAEYPVATAGRNRKLDQWKEKPGSPDNHLFDCLVGCAVAASMLGTEIGGATATAAAKPKVRLSDIYAAKHGGRRR
jgi:hypothetical protein